MTEVSTVLERGRGGGRPQSLWCRYGRYGRVRQTRTRKASHALIEGRESEQKKGPIRRWSPTKVVANGRGRRKRRLPFGPKPREEVQLSVRVGETSGTEGGGFGRRSQRQAVYVRVEPFQQCGH